MNKKQEEIWIQKISLELLEIPQFSYNERLWNPPLNHAKNNEEINKIKENNTIRRLSQKSAYKRFSQN